MMRSEEISHKGTVISSGPYSAVVRIDAAGACPGCKAAGLCGMSEIVEKNVEVSTRRPYPVGEEVEIVLKGSMGLKAVWLSYMIPLLILLAVVLGMSHFGVGEVPTALSAIGAVAVYYLILWLFRAHLKDEYVFTIKDK